MAGIDCRDAVIGERDLGTLSQHHWPLRALKGWHGAEWQRRGEIGSDRDRLRHALLDLPLATCAVTKAAESQHSSAGLVG